MGSGREKRGYSEIDETRQSAADDQFEEFLKKVEAAGATIIRDEYEPIYDSMGQDDYELGEKRVVEFVLAGSEFLVTREVKEAKITGQGHQKTVVELPSPQTEIHLKRRPEGTDQWVVVDLEDLM